MKAYSVPALLIAAVCLTIALSDALAWIRRNRRRSDVAFILVCLCGAAFCIFCAGEYSVDHPLESVFWLRGEVVSSTLAGLALLWFVAEKTGLVAPWALFAGISWALLSSLSQLLELGELTWILSRPFTLRVELPFGLDFVYREVERGPVLVAIAGTGFLLMLYLLGVVLEYRRRGNRKEAGALLASLCFILSAQVLDVLIGIGLLRFVFLLEYAWLATILFVGLQRSNDFIEAARTRAILERRDLELKESQATLSAIVDSTADMIWSVDAADFRLLSFNRGFRDRLAESRGIEVRLGMGLEELHDSEEARGRWREAFRQALREGERTFEEALPGVGRVFNMRINLLRREGEVFGLSVFGEDVTERKLAEERIERSLAEKEVLLQEVFHRTKNNMSVIISILRLQANQSGDQGLREAIAVSIDRIISMSMVHDRLYTSGDLSRIELGGYLRELAERLMRSYAPQDGRLSLALDLEEVAVPLESAINCGLVANELLTNALRHAFPGERRGEIRIRLEADGEGFARLSVSDDGVGPPPGFDPARDRRLGLRLVESLARGRLWAETAYATEGGFTSSLRFRTGEGKGG